MKKLLVTVLAFISILALSTGCKKDKIFEGIEVDIPSADLTLPSLAPPFPIAVPLHTSFILPIPIEQAFNLDDTIRKHTNNDFGAGDVKSVLIKSISIIVNNPTDSSNLSNFESATLYLSSNSNRNDSLKVADLTFTSSSYDIVTYTPANSSQIRPYLNGDTLIYKIKASLSSLTKHDMSLSIKAIVTAK